MSKQFDNRGDLRVPTRFETLLSSGRAEGVGVLTNVSGTGAMIDDATLSPKIGTEVRIYIFLQPVSPLELVGVVIRHTEQGFAVSYKEPSEEVRRMIEDAAAVVGGPKEG